MRIGPPQREAADRDQALEEEDVGLATAAGVSHGAEEGTQHRDDDARGRLREGPLGLTLDRVADHDVGEVLAEDEGGDDGEEGLVGPVEEGPAVLAELRGFLGLGHAGSVCPRSRRGNWLIASRFVGEKVRSIASCQGSQSWAICSSGSRVATVALSTRKPNTCSVLCVTSG